jgi:hypothetical protein
MSMGQKLKHELRSLCEATLYFGLWVFGLIIVKILILEEYHITFTGWSAALIGVLVLAKVVLILEHVSLGAWVRRQPAWLDVLLRTILYVAGVFVVMILEKSFEGRHEHGGFGNALAEIFQHIDMPHIWANTICIAGALLGYNILAVIRQHLGTGGLFEFFRLPLPDTSEQATSTKSRQSTEQ